MNETPAPPPKRRWLRRVAWTVAIVWATMFAAVTAMTFAQAWSMTHYQPDWSRSTRLRELNGWDKVRLLCCGPTIRRQSNTQTPRDFGMAFETRHFRGAQDLRIEAWRVTAPASAPVVLMFPGYGASKDTLLQAAREFHALGCAMWIVDPHGIGGSEGSVTSVGFHEAEDVAAAFREARRLDADRPVILYGPSMGAVAILRAVSVGWVQPDALILECPFDRLTTTIGNRYEWLGLPRFPGSQLVAFWIGAQQGFNGLAHNPVKYARRVTCPTLLLQGEFDESVGRRFVREVARNLGRNSRFELIPGASHAFLVTRAEKAWRGSVRSFLETLGGDQPRLMKTRAQ
jgi:hypothetical protein